jgi:hypothetical protein
VTERAKSQNRRQSFGRVSARTVSLIAWSMCASSLALTALSLFLLTLNTLEPGVPIFEHWIENTALAIGFSTVGAVVAPRSHPQNPMGWFFCVVGLLFAAVHFLAEYAIYALLAASGSLPAGEAAAWVCSWMFVPQLGLGGLLVLLFPDGRVPGAPWRWFVRLSVLVILVATVMAAFSPGRIAIGLGPIHNPLGIESLPNVYKLVEALLLSLVLVAGSAQVLRSGRTRGVERQQIKWFAYAIVVTVSGALLRYIIPGALSAPWLRWVGFVPMVVGVVSIPVAMGIAIQKYHLYDIDLLINRTLVYGSLTAMLIALYFGAIVGLQRLLVFLTGHESTLAVVASSLAIAALFMPLRRRIQFLIDRRFYRSTYDARKTLEASSARLRDETDLDALSDELVDVVRKSMQPARLSLWLRPDTAPKSEQAE